MYLYNTLTRKKEIFRPLKKKVGLYSCGPTVYHYAHIGNLRTYVFSDTLKRTLAANGYTVKHIMNITDVGHLTSDADSGEDKLEKGAAREHKTVWEVAAFYTKAFQNDLEHLNILPPDVWARATDHVKEQISLILKLEKRGFTYESEKAVYFDTSRVKNYGALAGTHREQTRTGAGQRQGSQVEIDKDKKHPTDFVLWFKRIGKYKDHAMHWPSPWGDGFPGWHIECSAMSMKYLGETFDIHTGGVDHIGTHHPNEIAQSESATGKKFARRFMHGGLLTVENQAKMAKSGENFITLDTLIRKKFHPLSFRYLVLNAHYRSQLEFSWESLAGAEKSLANLYQIAASSYPLNLSKPPKQNEKTFLKHKNESLKAIKNDLNTPQAIAVIWQAMRSRLHHSLKTRLLRELDAILGLKFSEVARQKTPLKIKKILIEREKCRSSKQFMQADRLRNRIERLGYDIEDTSIGPCLKPLSNYLPKI